LICSINLSNIADCGANKMNIDGVIAGLRAKGLTVEKLIAEGEEEEVEKEEITLLQNLGYKVEKTKITSKCE
jgi:hypothetical protein